MIKRRDITEVLLEIKKEMPLFDKNQIIEYTKWAIPILYESIKYGDTKNLKINCKSNLIKKLSKMKYEYRITDDIDRVSVHYAELFDFIKTENEAFVKLYISVYFYDNVTNNKPDEKEENNDLKDEGKMIRFKLDKNRNLVYKYEISAKKPDNKYWNDIWIVTYGKRSKLTNIKSANCSNCGAIMKYDETRNVLECEHCKNIVYGNLDNTDEWEIVDIDIGK